MRGLVPHILFLFHSLPLLPATPGDREQKGLGAADESPWGLVWDRGLTKVLTPSHVGPGSTSPLHPPTEGTGEGWRSPKASWNT